MKYIISIITVVIGFLIVWKSNWLVNNVGSIPWADEHMGSEGGSNLLYKLIGLLIILVTFITISGCLSRIASGIFSTDFGPTV
ncbi:MAG: hypothetical protein V1838_03490 [Patescibacteria group bacterium]